MIPLTLIMDAEGAWPELEGSDRVLEGEGLQIGVLANGTVKGRPSVVIRVDVGDDDGYVILTQTTLRLFLAAARAFEARYGPEVDDGAD